MSRPDALAEGLTSARVRAELDAVAGPPLRPIDYAAVPSDRPEGFGAPLNVPMGPTVRESDDGRLVVEWPGGRPSWFVMTPEALEQLVEKCNELVDDLALLEHSGPDLCRCGKPSDHLEADPGSDEWACRVPPPPYQGERLRDALGGPHG